MRWHEAGLYEDSSTKQEQLNNILKNILPTLCSFIFLLCFVNGITLLNLGVTKSPSSFVYLNIIIMDFLNAVTGIVIYSDPKSKHWFGVGSNIYLLSFDTQIFLIFGLALIRCFCLHMSALRIILNLQKIAYATVGISWMFGCFSIAYPYLLHAIRHNHDPLDFMDFAWIDGLECIIIAITIVLSVYTWCAIRKRRDLSGSIKKCYKSASNTNLLITLNFVASYMYYIFLNSARFYYESKNIGCPKNTWIEVFVCLDTLYIGLTFMCFQSLLSNVILLNQGRTKKFLLRHARMCIQDVKRKIQSIGNDDNVDYERFFN